MISLESNNLVEAFHSRIRDGVLRAEAAGITPHLAIVLVGADEESLRYIGIKTKVAKKLGITVSLYHLTEEEGVDAVRSTLDYLATDEEVHGIIIQLPLPDSIRGSTDELIARIPAAKDVDGLGGGWKQLHYAGVSLAQLEAPQAAAPLPPMVGAVLTLLDGYNLTLDHKHIVIVGNGRLVGQPLNTFLSNQGYDVEVVDDETPDILSVTTTADILITGTGESNLITYQWVKEGATVINCARDVHTDSVAQVAGALSPETGGVSPLTVCWLLHNVTMAALQGVA